MSKTNGRSRAHYFRGWNGKDRAHSGCTALRPRLDPDGYADQGQEHSAQHADLGGLDLVEYMYLNEIETPVIVVTGFDFFRVQPVQGVTELIGLEDLEQAIREKIGNQLITLVRFGSAGWADQLKSSVTGEGTAS